MEFLRLKKLQHKTDRECEKKCKYLIGLQQAELLMKKDEESLNITSCDWPHPFWWNYGTFEIDPKYLQQKSESLNLEDGRYSTASPKSWQKVPSYFRMTDDAYVRQKELLM